MSNLFGIWNSVPETLAMSHLPQETPWSMDIIGRIAHSCLLLSRHRTGIPALSQPSDPDVTVMSKAQSLSVVDGKIDVSAKINCWSESQ